MPAAMNLPPPPAIEEIRTLRTALDEWLTPTPVVRCPSLESGLGSNAEVWAKLEFLQRTGTFKARGALTVMQGLSDGQRRAGVTAVSAGNHAIAVAFAAKAFGTPAKVVMLRTSNAARMERCREFGAEVELADDVHSAFAAAKRIEAEEGRFFVHPFEGADIARGTATLGMEIVEQISALDAVVVPIGGGGLCAGIACAVKQLRPSCAVYGVEPQGADSMRRSLASGAPETIDRVNTIADSLGAPYALPYSFDLCRRFVDKVVLVDDEELRRAMRFLFRDMSVAIEPACAATTAAALGPLAERLRGQRIALVMCGSNIDWDTYSQDTGIGKQDV